MGRNYNLFGDNLRRIMKERGISHLGLADLTGMSAQRVTHLLNHFSYPSLYTALTIADALNLPITELTEGKE